MRRQRHRTGARQRRRRPRRGGRRGRGRDGRPGVGPGADQPQRRAAHRGQRRLRGPVRLRQRRRARRQRGQRDGVPARRHPGRERRRVRPGAGAQEPRLRRSDLESDHHAGHPRRIRAGASARRLGHGRAGPGPPQQGRLAARPDRDRHHRPGRDLEALRRKPLPRHGRAQLRRHLRRPHERRRPAGRHRLHRHQRPGRRPQRRVYLRERAGLAARHRRHRRPAGHVTPDRQRGAQGGSRRQQGRPDQRRGESHLPGRPRQLPATGQLGGHQQADGNDLVGQLLLQRAGSGLRPHRRHPGRVRFLAADRPLRSLERGALQQPQVPAGIRRRQQPGAERRRGRVQRRQQRQQQSRSSTPSRPRWPSPRSSSPRCGPGCATGPTG